MNCDISVNRLGKAKGRSGNVVPLAAIISAAFLLAEELMFWSFEAGIMKKKMGRSWEMG